MLDYQITFNGLTIGNGTPYQIVGLDGVEDLPSLRTGDLAVAFADGETPGLDLLNGRDITVQLQIFDSGAGDYFTNLERIKAATVPTAGEQPFVYQLPGRLPRTLNVRARKRAMPVGVDYQFRKSATVIGFHATDPRIYDQSFTAAGTGLPTATSGLTFNATAPFVFGAVGSGGTVAVTNLGNYPAPWVAQLAGPLVNPSILLQSTGQMITLNLTIAAGDVVTIDSLARTVLLNGTASRYSSLAAGSQWFALPVGASTVQFGAASGTGTVTVSYRSTWV